MQSIHRKGRKRADCNVIGSGSIVILSPVSARAAKWLRANVAAESWQWLGRALACESRMAADICEGMNAAGLRLAGGAA